MELVNSSWQFERRSQLKGILNALLQETPCCVCQQFVSSRRFFKMAKGIKPISVLVNSCMNPSGFSKHITDNAQYQVYCLPCRISGRRKYDRLELVQGTPQWFNKKLYNMNYSVRARAARRKLPVPHKITREELRGWYKQQTLFCYWCQKRVTTANMHFDHKMPISKGGTNTVDNLVLSCSVCNYYKRNLHPDDWKALFEFLNNRGMFKAFLDAYTPRMYWRKWKRR